MRLSPTKLSAMSKCPYSFKLQYVGNVKKVKDSASLTFGKTIHSAIEMGIRQNQDVVNVFKDQWEKYKGVDLEYSQKEDWQLYNEKGLALSTEFQSDYLRRFRNTYLVEGELSFDIDPQTRLHGRLDYVGDFVTEDGEILKAIVDFKTSSSKYSQDKIMYNDQLTAYSIGAKRFPFEINALVLVVFVKTKTPYIQVVVAEKRSEKEMSDYMETVRYHLENIYRGRYPKIKGDHCGWCDYNSLCTGIGKVDDLMIQVKKYNPLNGTHSPLLELYPGKYNHLHVSDDERPMSHVERLIKEYNIPVELEMGFEVTKQYRSVNRSFLYWWKDGELKKVTDYYQEVA